MGEATVVGSNPLKETVLVQLESQATVEVPLSEITVEDWQLHKQEQKKKRKN